MAKSKPIDLGYIQFNTQKDAEKHFSTVLHRYELGQTVEGDDAKALGALILRHSKADEKIGCGVKRFFVQEDGYGGRCFGLERMNGTLEHFSFMHCVRGKGPTLEQKIRKVFYKAIWKDLFKFKRDFFKQSTDTGVPVHCKVTGEAVRFKEAKVDYEPPTTLDEIIRKFASDRGIALDQSLLCEHRDRQTGPKLRDSELAEAFRKFHSSYSLRIVKKGSRRVSTLGVQSDS